MTAKSRHIFVYYHYYFFNFQIFGYRKTTHVGLVNVQFAFQHSQISIVVFTWQISTSGV